jgi:hypothetical protein
VAKAPVVDLSSFGSASADQAEILERFVAARIFVPAGKEFCYRMGVNPACITVVPIEARPEIQIDPRRQKLFEKIWSDYWPTRLTMGRGAYYSFMKKHFGELNAENLAVFLIGSCSDQNGVQRLSIIYVTKGDVQHRVSVPGFGAYVFCTDAGQNMGVNTAARWRENHPLDGAAPKPVPPPAPPPPPPTPPHPH